MKRGLSENQSKKGLTKQEKFKIFFLGIFMIFILGTRVFYHLPGTSLQKKQILFYYLCGLFFWVMIFFLAFFLIDYFN